MTSLSILLALGSPPTLREILDPIKRGYPLYLLFGQPYILCSPNYKGQIKGVKLKDDLEVTAYPKKFWDKRKEVLT